MNYADTVAILGGLAGIGGLIAGIWEFRRRTDLEIFRTYSEKYNKIITPDIHDKWNRACESSDPKDWEGLDEIAIAYLNLVWEETYLNQTGTLQGKIWEIWLKEINEVCKTPFAKKMMKDHRFIYLIEDLEKINQSRTQS